MPVTGNTGRTPDSEDTAQTNSHSEQYKQFELQETMQNIPDTGSNAKLIIDNPMYFFC